MTHPRPPRQLTHVLSGVERRLTARLRAVLTPEECSVEEWRVLELLADHVGHTMSELAEYALLLPPTVTKLVDRMVSDNLVYRRVDPLDRRRVRTYLTPRGHERHQRLRHKVAAHEAELLAAIGGGDQLIHLLTDLAEALGERTRVDAE